MSEQTKSNTIFKENITLDITQETIDVIALQKSKQKINGFREGKVPLMLIKHIYGNEIIEKAAFLTAYHHQIKEGKYAGVEVESFFPTENGWKVKCNLTPLENKEVENIEVSDGQVENGNSEA